MVTQWFVWVGLFVATLITDMLSARWVDARTRNRRAGLSALHEFVGIAAGFLIYQTYHSLWLSLPCVLGAAAGSWLADVNKPEPPIDPALLQAIHDTVEVVMAEQIERSKAA